MNPCYDRLDFVLGQQVAGLTALKNWLPRKIELLRQPRLPELEALNAREESHMQALRQLESERHLLEGLLRNELDVAPQTALSQLVTCAPPPVRQRLESKLSSLMKLASEVRDANAIAQGLVLRTKVVVDATLDAVAELSRAQSASPYGLERTAPQAQTWMINRTA